MSENTEIVGQIDLFTNEVVVEKSETLTLESIIEELVGDTTTFTPYKIAKLINEVFAATSTDKVIPPQMMYIYASKGMISKGNKSKSYNENEVKAFVFKYTSKHVTI